MTGPYDDILHLPHHVSATRAHMPIRDRAAQFSPFAALTGYEAAIKETARLTDERRQLDESEKEILNGKLQAIAEHLKERPQVVITCFKPDERKAGGAYITVAGAVIKINPYRHVVIMEDGQEVRIEDVFDIKLQEIFNTDWFDLA